MIFRQFKRFITLCIVLTLCIVSSSKAQFGDYSVNIRVDNFAQGVGHDSYVIFGANLGGPTSIGWEISADAYALPPAFGQPMIYTEITHAPFPGGANEIQYNVRPPLTEDWTVPLGFYSGAGSSGTYTLTFNWLNTIPAGIDVELEDLQLSSTQDLLLTNTYTYTGNFSDSEDRFRIHFTYSGGGCEAPDSPTTSTVTTDGFDVSWTCSSCTGGEAFIVEYGLSGFTPGTGASAGAGGTVINPAVSTESISGLLASTTYDVYVRSDCGGTYSSNTSVVSETTASPSCTEANVPVITATPNTICPSGSSTLSWTGNLNDATAWHVYTTSCGVTQLTTTASNSIVVSPASTATYFIRGEDGAGCVDESTGLCGSEIVTVNALDDASFAYSAASYCIADADPTPTITGVAGGAFSAIPAGLSIDAGTGMVDLSASTLGVYTVTYTTAGSCPNSSDVSFIIDVTAVNAICQNVSVYLDESGNASITANEIDGGSTFCGAGTVSTDITTFTCTDIGPNDVILTAEDGASNTSTCTAQVTVLDTVSPTAICQNISVYLDGAGNASISASDIDGGSTDNCAVALLTADITSFTCADIGPNDVILTVEDGSSNTSLCTAQVMVLDTVSPTAICQNITVYLDNTGNATISGTDVIGGSTDNCDILDPSMVSFPVSCGQVGVNIVAVPVTDVNGNVSECFATLTILDTVSPVVVCQDVTVYLDASGVAVISANDIDNGSLDNCGIADLALDNTSFTCSNLGIVAVTLTATDNSGNTNSCSANVTVLDTIAPQAICQNITVYLDGTGNAIIDALDADGGSTDNCEVASRSLSVTNFDCSSLGANSTTLTITDPSGNSNTCTAIVTVLDTTPPAITCPIVPAQCGDNVSGGIVTFTLPTATDNCSATVTQVDATSLNSGSIFPTGTTTLTYEAEDADGNTATCSFDVVVLAQPSADFIFTPSCLGETMFFTDESTINPSGNIVSWLWDMGDGSGPITIVDPTHVYAAVGTYTVTLTVESADACTDTYNTTVTVTEVPVADFSATTECLETATVFTNNSSIDPGYTGGLNYVWDFGDGTTATDENPTHTYNSDGTYTASLTVTTDDGCEDVITNSITVLEQPTALFVYSETCVGSSTDFTDLSVGSGLTYDWDFGDSNSSTDQHPTHTYANAGTYTVVLTVTNGSGCVNSISMSVMIMDSPVVGFSFSNSCEETSVGFTNTSDSGTYAWDFDDGNSSILSNPSNTYLNSGTYDVTLTVTNANGCMNQLTQQIEIFDNPEFTLTPSDVLCFEDATGNILVSPTVGAAPLDFILDGDSAQVGSTFSDLFAGIYTVTVTDDNGCSTSDDVTVGEPAAALGVSINDLTDILCHGDASGSIDVSGTGGTNPYTLSLNGGAGQGNGMFSNVMTGTHDLNIIDDNGCMFDTTLTLTEPDTLVLMVDSLSNLMCNGDSSGWIDVVGTGGVMPYEYSIDGLSFDIQHLFNTLDAGAYTITVLDANGCTDTVNLTITEPGVLMLSLLGTTDALCNGQASGTVSVAASSGTSPYQYSIDGGLNWQASGDFAGIGAGAYTVIIMDDNDCTTEVAATVGEPTALTIATSSSPVLCVGDSTGTIDIVAGGGTPSYIYSIDGGGSYQATSSYSGLPAGTYVTVVQDSLGCTASESVVISQPTNSLFGSALIQSILCVGDSTGIIQVQATGGTGSYTYSIDAGANSQVVNSFENLPAGAYEIVVEDVNGCTLTVEAEVEGPTDPLEILDAIITQPSCPGDADGTFAIQATGGTAPYQYSSNGGSTFISSSLFTGAIAGSYNLEVMDDHGCLTSQVITVMDPDSMVLTVDSIVKVNCDGDSDGLIYVSATGGTGNITYQLNGAAPQATGQFNGISSGIHTIVATDSAGCSVNVTMDATANNPLPNPSFTFLVSGETVAFTNTSLFGNTYSWDFGDGLGTSTDEDPTYTYNGPGNYDVTLTVTNDCGTVDTLITISTIVFGVEDVDLVQGLIIYPNPSSGELNLSFNLNSQVDELNLQVFDTRGRAVHSQAGNNLSGQQNMTIDLNDASKGVYRLRLIADDFSQTMRIVIAK